MHSLRHVSDGVLYTLKCWNLILLLFAQLWSRVTSSRSANLSSWLGTFLWSFTSPAKSGESNDTMILYSRLFRYEVNQIVDDDLIPNHLSLLMKHTLLTFSKACENLWFMTSALPFLSRMVVQLCIADIRLVKYRLTIPESVLLVKWSLWVVSGHVDHHISRTP